jgi:hypothetical protein
MDGKEYVVKRTAAHPDNDVDNSNRSDRYDIGADSRLAMPRNQVGIFVAISRGGSPGEKSADKSRNYSGKTGIQDNVVIHQLISNIAKIRQLRPAYYTFTIESTEIVTQSMTSTMSESKNILRAQSLSSAAQKPFMQSPSQIMPSESATVRYAYPA